MPELRKDPVTGRWVIISTERRKRPNDFRFERPSVIGRDQCPFCPGRESLTPPELVARLDPLLRRFAAEREPGEHFGDFCHRFGAINPAAAPAETATAAG